MLTSILIGLQINTKDLDKPDGEACNEDGTLKDVEEMVWVNSPSDLPPAVPSLQDNNVDQDDDLLPATNLQRCNVGLSVLP